MPALHGSALRAVGAFEGLVNSVGGYDDCGGGDKEKEFAVARVEGRAFAERLDDRGAGAMAVEVVIGAVVG